MYNPVPPTDSANPSNQQRLNQAYLAYQACEELHIRMNTFLTIAKTVDPKPLDLQNRVNAVTTYMNTVFYPSASSELPSQVEEHALVDYDTWYRFDPLVIPAKGQLVEMQGTMRRDSWTRNNLSYWVVLDYRQFRGVVRCPYQFARGHWLQRDAGAPPMQSVTCLWYSMIPLPGALRWRFTDQLPPAGISTPEALVQTGEAVYPADVAVDRNRVPRSLIRVDDQMVTGAKNTW
jgi:hypothetical protein